LTLWKGISAEECDPQITQVDTELLLAVSLGGLLGTEEAVLVEVKFVKHISGRR